MQTEYFIILIPLIGLALNSLSQVIIIRYIKKIGMLKSIISGFFIGLVSVIYLELSVQGRFLLIDFVTNLLIYISLGYCYFHFINLGETARRIRILIEIYNSKSNLSLEEILSKYNAKLITDARLKRLVSNKQIKESVAKYYISNQTMVFFSKIINLMKLIILTRKNRGIS